MSRGLRRWLWRLLVLEALFWLLAANLSLRLAPFRRLAPLLGAVGKEVREDAVNPVADCRQTAAQRIGLAVRRATRATPWPARCLAQAMAAKAMLACRGMTTRLHLGVKTTAGSALEAHAWLTLDGAMVVGGANRREFAELARFG